MRFRFYVKLVERTTAKDSTQRAQRKEAQRAQRREERRLVGGGTKKARRDSSTAKADALAGASAKENASACSARNDRGGAEGGAPPALGIFWGRGPSLHRLG